MTDSRATPLTEAVLEAVWKALARWDAGERTASELRAITKADVRRQDRLADGTHIPTPRRNALARYLTDAVLTALRETEAEAAQEAHAVVPDGLRGILAAWLWQFNDEPRDGEPTFDNFQQADELIEHLRVCRIAFRAATPAEPDHPEPPTYRATYDPEAEAVYVYLSDKPQAETVEVTDEVNVDVDADGTPIGVEVLNVGRVEARPTEGLDG